MKQDTDRMIPAASPVVAGVIAAIGLVAVLAIPARAQEIPFMDAERGTFLIHGNYCGPGNRSPRPPIDALDAACMRHDLCSPPRGQPATCACNERLHAEAAAIARDPHQPESVRDTAEFVSETATALPCR